MIPDQCIEVQTSPITRPSVPPWFAEVAILARHLATHDLPEAFGQHVRLVRGRFGSYEPIDFLVLLLGYAISGERTLSDFFERVEPFGTAFMAQFGRKCLPHRSSLSRFLADVDGPCLQAFRTLFEQHSFVAGWTVESIGGLWDRQARRSIVFDVDATRQAARQRALPCDVWSRMCWTSIMDAEHLKPCSQMKMLKRIQIAGVPTRRADSNCGKLRVNGCGTCA